MRKPITFYERFKEVINVSFVERALSFETFDATIFEINGISFLNNLGKALETENKWKLVSSKHTKHIISSWYKRKSQNLSKIAAILFPDSNLSMILRNFAAFNMT